MSSRSVFLVPARLISHSCCLRAKPAVLTMTSAVKVVETSTNMYNLTKRCYNQITPTLKKLKLPKDETVPVETDTEKLAKYVCGTNLFNEGEDVKVKPDSEYPDWLWKISAPRPLEELDKNSKTYWNRITKMKQKQIKYLRSLDKTSTVHK